MLLNGPPSWRGYLWTVLTSSSNRMWQETWNFASCFGPNVKCIPQDYSCLASDVLTLDSSRSTGPHWRKLVPGTGILLKVLILPWSLCFLAAMKWTASHTCNHHQDVQAHWVNDHRLNVLKSWSQMILPAFLILQQNKLMNQGYPLLSWCLRVFFFSGVALHLRVWYHHHRWH